MFFIPYNFFFLMSLFMSILISVSSANWIWVWVGIEINMLSFIPLIKSVKDNYIFRVVECSVKYFIAQAIGSGVFLLGYILILIKYFRLLKVRLSLVLILLSLLIKVGAAPFHFWFPIVIKGLCWFSCGILIIFQKIIPLVIFSCTLGGGLHRGLLMFCILGSVIGGVGGLNQTNLRFLLSYSSIGHIGWILIGCISSYNVFLIYFVIYSIISFRIIFFFNCADFRNIVVDGIFLKGLYMGILLFLFFSLRGIPPFLGFFPKWLIIDILRGVGIIRVGIIILLGSLFNIFYYLKVIINIILSGFNLIQGLKFYWVRVIHYY